MMNNPIPKSTLYSNHNLNLNPRHNPNDVTQPDFSLGRVGVRVTGGWSTRDWRVGVRVTGGLKYLAPANEMYT